MYICLFFFTVREISEEKNILHQAFKLVKKEVILINIKLSKNHSYGCKKRVLYVQNLGLFIIILFYCTPSLPKRNYFPCLDEFEN